MLKVSSKNKCIGMTDEPSGTDFLGLGEYVRSLSRFIMTSETPMTISLQGGWGTGKTSLFRQIEANLEKERSMSAEEKGYNVQYELIRLNTWQFSVAGYQDDLIFVLIMKIIETLSGRSVLTDVKSFFQNELRPSLPIILGILTNNEALTDYVGNKVEASGNTVLSYNSVDALKTEFQKQINKHCIVNEKEVKRLIVFIDDLDRLAPEKAVELLEGIKNFIDCAHCVFILAIDEEVIYEGIEKKFGEKLAENRKQRFFDKIIQVPFSLPVPSYDIRNFIAHLLRSNHFSDQNPEVIETYIRTVQKIIGENNPRSIKRLFNLLQLHESFLQSRITITDENRCMLFALVAFQVKNKKKYDELIRNRDSQKEEIRELLYQDKAFRTLDRAIGGHFGKAPEDEDNPGFDETAFETFCEILQGCPDIEEESVYTDELIAEKPQNHYEKARNYILMWTQETGGSIRQLSEDSLFVYRDDGRKIAKITKSERESGIGANLTFYQEAYDRDFPDAENLEFVYVRKSRSESWDNTRIPCYINGNAASHKQYITAVCSYDAEWSHIEQLLKTYME